MTDGPRRDVSSRLVLRLSIAGCFFIPAQSAWAGDEIRASADVATTVGWSSNPFSEAGSSQSSAFAQVDVRPTVSVVAEHSTISLDGLFNYQHYFRNYPDSNDYGVGLDYVGTLSQRLTVHADARYDSAIIGGFDALTTVINPALPLPPVTIGPELALVGSRDRRRTLSFAGDAGYALSAYDSVTANAYYSQSRYGAGIVTVSNYDSYGGGLGYSRRVSPHLQLGVQGSAARYVYQGLLGHSQVYTLQATFRDQFSDSWSASGAVGASISDQSVGGRQTNLTGNIQLCRQASRSTLCVTASEAVLPTGGVGTVSSKSVGASYFYRLSEHSNFALSGQYSRNDQPISTVLANRFNIGNSYVTLAANYDRTLKHRIHLIAETHFRKIMGNIGNYPADFGGSLGFSIRLGK